MQPTLLTHGAPTFHSFPRHLLGPGDSLLRHIAEGLQLTKAQHAKAVAAYTDVARYMASPTSPFHSFGIDIYPQGSMASDTTVRPPRGNEFDLDLVMQLAIQHGSVQPMTLLDLTFQYVKQHSEFGPIAERKDRCIRLNYAGDFHLDVVPACLDGTRGPTAIQVPDRSVKSWKPSNPKGLLGWFNRRKVPLSRLDGHTLKASVAPPPSQASSEEKSPLQLAIQFLKRNRDVCFLDQPELATPSILLKVLAGTFYNGSPSAVETLFTIASAFAAFACDHESPPVLLNPADPTEIISEKWHDVPASWHHFREWAQNASRLMSTVVQGTNLEPLKSFVGASAVTEGLRRQAAEMTSASAAGRLGVLSGGTLVTPSSQNSGIPIRPHHFFGE